MKPSDVDSSLSQSQLEFFQENEKALTDFVESSDDSLHLPPMNSYNRRLIHKIAAEFNVNTTSEGEGDERHVVLVRTEDSLVPEGGFQLPVPVWDFKHREFIVRYSKKGIPVFLSIDGNVGLDENLDPEIAVVDRHLVTTGSFKIRKNKIIEFDHEDW